MLSAESIEKIEYELSKYPQDRRQAAVMSALRIVQMERGWLSKESISEVAKYLRIPEIAALEVATFYNMYDLEPVGEYKITICTNISCMLPGFSTWPETENNLLPPELGTPRSANAWPPCCMIHGIDA